MDKSRSPHRGWQCCAPLRRCAPAGNRLGAQITEHKLAQAGTSERPAKLQAPRTLVPAGRAPCGHAPRAAWPRGPRQGPCQGPCMAKAARRRLSSELAVAILQWSPAPARRGARLESLVLCARAGRAWAGPSQLPGDTKRRRAEPGRASYTFSFPCVRWRAGVPALHSAFRARGEEDEVRQANPAERSYQRADG